MAELEIRTFDSYDAFARYWHADTLAEHDLSLEDARDRGFLDEQETRQLWQLLGLLSEGELVIKIPEWLAEEKVRLTNRATPTMFVGRISRETEKAILFADSAATRSLTSLAHRIRSLEDGLSNTADNDNRRDWLERRLQEKREAFEAREELVSLRDEWIPKSQVQIAFQRKVDR